MMLDFHAILHRLSSSLLGRSVWKAVIYILHSAPSDHLQCTSSEPASRDFRSLPFRRLVDPLSMLELWLEVSTYPTPRRGHLRVAGIYRVQRVLCNRRMR
jgi:hypothetical protein